MFEQLCFFAKTLQGFSAAFVRSNMGVLSQNLIFSKNSQVIFVSEPKHTFTTVLLRNIQFYQAFGVFFDFCVSENLYAKLN